MAGAALSWVVAIAAVKTVEAALQASTIRWNSNVNKWKNFPKQSIKVAVGRNKN